MGDEEITGVANWGPGCFVHMTYTATQPGQLGLKFMCGGDTPFLCNPRYDQQTLVLNTQANGQWQGEERPPNFPLVYGQPTQIVAAVNDQTIDVFANKRQFCYSYRHRYDVGRVNQIHCKGKGTPITSWVGKALPNFEVGKIVYIKGQTPVGKNFNVDMVPSLPHDYRWENDAMHMSCRFNENAVVRNHKSNNAWGQEERHGGVPFAPGQPFTMTVVAQKHGFEVGVNGSHFCFFRYRLPLSKDMSIQFHNLDYIEKIEYN